MMQRSGWSVSALACAFFVFDGVSKLLLIEPVRQSAVQLGIPEGQIRAIALLLLACTAVYLVPRTAFLGAVLLTAYLGGATATLVRVGDPFSFPILMGALVWAGLWLRDARLRALVGLSDVPGARQPASDQRERRREAPQPV